MAGSRKAWPPWNTLPGSDPRQWKAPPDLCPDPCHYDILACESSWHLPQGASLTSPISQWDPPEKIPLCLGSAPAHSSPCLPLLPRESALRGLGARGSRHLRLIPPSKQEALTCCGYHVGLGKRETNLNGNPARLHRLEERSQNKSRQQMTVILAELNVCHSSLLSSLHTILHVCRWLTRFTG